MKKVLLIILAGMFALTSAYAQPSFTLGVGLNKGVFAAEGKEDNFDESGSLNSTTRPRRDCFRFTTEYCEFFKSEVRDR